MKDHPLDSTDLAWLSRLARALLGEVHAADDLVQETAVAAMEGVIPAEAPRRAWLASVARRLAARRFRGEDRRARREEEVARPESLPDSSELVEKAEVAEHVTAAARRLPEPYRRTILLRFLEGLSPEEIARREGKPADTVRWRVRRGLELLREELVRRHDRDWSSWSVLLLPLARSNGGAGFAIAGASGASVGTVASLTVMKMIVTAAVLSCTGLWWVLGSEANESNRALEPAGTTVAQVEQAEPEPRLKAELEAPEAEPERSIVTMPTPEEPVAADPAPEPTGLFGRVVDEEGEPVDGATVYLIPTLTNDNGERSSGDLRARGETDWRGEFRFEEDDWRRDSDAEGGVLDLGVAANGFLRASIADVLNEPDGEILITLQRGRTLSGLVVDEDGLPVPDLELLVYTGFAAVDHVSPSQRLLRAERKNLAGAFSAYEQCRATTNGRGEVEFAGLPAGELNLVPLDPGWTIEDPTWVEADGSFVIWTAASRMGVRLTVLDSATGQPVERAGATFGFEATFANGEVRDFSQWVGRGVGGASYVVRSQDLPGIYDRTITSVKFYGTARAEAGKLDGKSVDWVAEPIQDSEGVTGVAEVTVTVDPVMAAVEEIVEDIGVAKLTLDVAYEDSAAFGGELVVRWTSKRDPNRRGKERLEPTELGRFEVEVPAEPITLEVYDRYASGSLPSWWGEASGLADEEIMAFVTLRRGATASITRPEGWSGEWFLHASYRPRGEEEWRGSWGYSTDESSLTLSVLRSAEWRFELRRYSALDPDPVVRTVFVEEGASVVVGD